jgi:hypothetical protein
LRGLYAPSFLQRKIIKGNPVGGEENDEQRNGNDQRDEC